MLDRSGVAAVQALGHAQEHTQHAHNFLRLLVQRRELLVFLAGSRPAVKHRRGGDQVDLGRVETEQVGVMDQVIGVRRVVVVGEKCPGIVERLGSILILSAVP